MVKTAVERTHHDRHDGHPTNTAGSSRRISGDIFKLASGRGAASALQVHRSLIARDQPVPLDWPFSQVDALYLVLDLWPEADLALARRLARLARESAQLEWRRLVQTSRKGSGEAPCLSDAHEVPTRTR